MYRNIFIYIYIWNGDNTSKNKLVFPTSFGRGCSQGICRICDLQVTSWI